MTDFIKLSLSFHHRQMLRLIAERGGRIEYRFNSAFQMPANFPANLPVPTEQDKIKIVRESDESIRTMEKMGLILIVPLVGAGEGKNELSLTDIGRNVIDQMKIQVKS